MSSREETILVPCGCGRQYRVPAVKSGKIMTCRGCGARVPIPRLPALSTSSRSNVLLSVGIDPVAAGHAFERERLEEAERESGRRSYRCTRCEERVDSTALSQAYFKGELVCEACRELLREDESEVRKRDRAIASVRKGRRLPRSLGRALVLFLGFSGPLGTIFHVPVGAALAIGLVIALVGGLATHSR